MTSPARRKGVYLGIDSATRFLALALWSPAGGVLAGAAPELGREHASRLVDELEALLAVAGVGRDEVQGVGVGVGPGSYTGLRVGVASARGVARALGVPLAGCDTLAAMAFGALAPGETGAALIDARRGNVYVGVYRRDGEELATLEAPAKRPRGAHLAELARRHPGLRPVEDVAPDASYIARRVPFGESPDPRYL